MPMRPARDVRTHDAYLISGQGIYEESSTQQFELETRLQLGSRVFYYASAGEALYAGFGVQQALVGGAGTTLQNTQAVTVAAAAGAKRIYVNALTTAQTANVFAEGWAAVFDATTTGKCWLFKVKGNSALATSGTASYIDLYDEIPEALTTSDQVSLIANPYKGTLLTNISADGGPLGVAPINVTSAYYFWLQTYGPAAVYPITSVGYGDSVVASDDTSGGLSANANVTLAAYPMGYCLHTGTANESAIVFLTMRA